MLSRYCFHQLRAVHQRLGVLHDRLITQQFGPLCVAVCVQTVLDLTVQLYQLYGYAVRRRAGELSDWLAAYTVMWFGMHAAKAALVAALSDRVEREVSVAMNRAMGGER